ncbi:hypothetical protein M758_UG303600 [Ceratodon purpureus]|nr:hypothetical protein M758_UG303600 [Ceratodon purpureus]
MVAQNAHGRAVAMQTKAKENRTPKFTQVDGSDQRTAKSGEESIWEDTFLIANSNLEFVTDRVSKLRESIASQKRTVGANEVTYLAIKEDTEKKSNALKSEKEKMDALIDFFSHPDRFERI